MSADVELYSMHGRHLDGERCDSPPDPSSDGSSRDALCGHGRLFAAELDTLPTVDLTGAGVTR